MLLTPDGVTFKERRADAGTEFVRSSDNWFRPVNFVNAPDGTLYCLDMSREILESIHIPFDVLKFIDLKAGRDSGRLYRIAPDGFRFPGQPQLEHGDDGRTRGAARSIRTAGIATRPIGLLFERQDKSAVVRCWPHCFARAPMPQARLYALWSLEGLAAMETADLEVALGDPHRGPPRARACAWPNRASTASRLSSKACAGLGRRHESARANAGGLLAR